MRIAILSRNKNLYSTRRLLEAGLQAGHDVRIIDHVRCFMDSVLIDIGGYSKYLLWPLEGDMVLLVV